MNVRRWGIGTLVAVGVVAGATLTAAEPSSVGPPPPVDGAAGERPALSAGAMWYPWAPGPGELGANPMAFSIDHVLDGRTVKKVVASWGRNEDTPTAPLRNTRAVAENNGQVFVPYDALPPEFTMVATTRLRDGSVLSASFVPVPVAAPNRVGVRMAHSTDVAKSWTTWTAPLVENLWKLNWYRVHRDLIELADGTILLGGYGQGTIGGVTKEYSLVFESTDGGRTFRQRAAVNAGSPNMAAPHRLRAATVFDGRSASSAPSTNEMGMGRTSDGRLIAVLRGTEPAPRPPAMPLAVTFSADDGRTWEPVRPYVPPAGLPNNGVMPKLLLQPNGQLLMTYGRPDNNVVVSRDGTGRTWDTGTVLYSRYPGEDPIRRWMGSSGNMDLVALNNSASLAFGDTCHNIWLCREYGHDNKVWTRKVDAIGPGVGKLDLATKVRAGTVTLAGDVVAADPAFAEQRLAGVVDGSAEYRSAARFGTRQELTVTLDRAYPLNRIGLMMARGEANSAVVEVSLDGQSWRRVARTGVRTDYAMRYHDIEPVRARHLRIRAAGDARLTAVTELELSAKDLLTFENDAAAGTPRAVKDTRYAFVANTILPGFDNSSSHLVLVDADQGAKATATFPAGTPARTQRVTFGFEGWGYGTGAIWEVLGTDRTGAEVTAYRLHFGADWTNNRMRLRAWDGSSWVDVGAAGPVVPNKTWMSIAIESTGKRTIVLFNGVELGATTAPLAEVRRFTGLRASTGLDPVDVGNMEHAYDDVAIKPLV